MKKLGVVAFVLLLLSPAAFAQGRAFDLNAFGTWVDSDSEGTFDTTGDDLDVSFDAQTGYGLGANVFFGNRLSVEFAVSRVEQEPLFRRRAVNVSGDAIEMMPITAVVQFHFAPEGFIDPYVGAGAAYVLFDDVDELNDVDNNLESIDFDDDVGLALNAGLSLRLTPRFAVFADAKYVPLESSATARYISGPGVETTFDINPIIVTGGISLRF